MSSDRRGSGTDIAHGFAAIVGENPSVLILGSLPGQASLVARAYYAMPRNAFWPIMSTVTGVAAEASYADRCAGLKNAGLALWDVCASAQRPGSLDAHIRPLSVQANPIDALLNEHRSIHTVLFNGRMAAALYQRWIAPSLNAERPALRYHVLPSTSPAHAAKSFQSKCDEWRGTLRAAFNAL